MDRKSFLQKLGLAGLAGVGLSQTLKSNSTYDRLLNNTDWTAKQVGHNHLPNVEEKTMNTVLHKADSRGHANHGWLDTHHTFSFANYYNPERMHFGVLRVLNDDQVAPGMGFGTHPHDNMEIISIPLEGDLEHKDSMGNSGIIKSGDVQVMSAGTGIMHSEYNANKDSNVKFLQIWVFPNSKNVTPRYDQISIGDLRKKNEFYQILSPNADDSGVWIHQNAWFHLGEFEAGKSFKYEMKDKRNGLYAFVIDGDVEFEGQELTKRDGMGVWNTEGVGGKTNSTARVLLMEVPMQLN